jgi:putative transposase
MKQGAINRAPTVGEIVRAFKARCTHDLNQMRNTQGMPVWQRNYYERIIRSDNELNKIREYIANNPSNWQEDNNFMPDLHPMP